MKKIIKGFTLAEVLITLSIVGVIASLTMPSLLTSSMSQQASARLATTVSVIERAMTTMISVEEVRNLYGTRAWAVVQDADVEQLDDSSNDATIRAFVGNLKQYLSITDFYNQSQRDYYGSSIKAMDGALDWRGEDNEINDSIHAFPIELTNGATIFMKIFPNGDDSTKITNEQRQAVINAGGSLFSDAADVFIDVNGKNGPNTIGRDLFNFYLGSDGHLYAAGGRDVAAYENSGIWSDSESMWACTNNVVKNYGWGCTARVVSNGYKIDY